MESGPTGDQRWDFGNASYWNDTQVWMYKGHNITAFRNLTAVAEYFANFVAFYTAGGFTDSKTGRRYESSMPNTVGEQHSKISPPPFCDKDRRILGDELHGPKIENNTLYYRPCNICYL